ncbi:MAG: OmpA family protein [Phycisphaeraceae bacterium]|nr:OmpA family protein [Phycisphaerales bacterium]MCB9859091.1 OmpA family protein [Phycisphaeraceae bacterium]
MSRNHTSRFGSTVRRAVFGAAAVIVGFGALTGCTSEQAYADIREENRALNERITKLSSENLQYQSAAGVQQSELIRQEQTISDLRQANTQLTDQITNMGGRIDDLNRRLVDTPLTMLDPGTDRALRNLALSYPNLLSYDSETGMIRFTSDLTFNSGSDVVNPGALEALQTFARVLQTEASIYDVQVVGHTDSQPISSKSAKNHPTNRHLACHRAIAVANSLVNTGVPATRIMAGGWGEYRPLVPNAANGNTPQNRRVEIFLTKSTAGIGYGSNLPNNMAPITTTPNRPVTQVPEEVVK